MSIRRKFRIQRSCKVMHAFFSREQFVSHKLELSSVLLPAKSPSPKCTI
jgi:hypothetical protein